MGDSPSSMQTLARQLLAREAAAGGDGVVRATERLYRVLSGQLEPFVGAEGFHALFARAVHRARAEYRVLDGLEIELSAGGVAETLVDRLRQADAARAEGIAVAVFGGFLELLAGFIGEDLAVQFVSRARPKASAPGSEEAASDGERR